MNALVQNNFGICTAEASTTLVQNRVEDSQLNYLVSKPGWEAGGRGGEAAYFTVQEVSRNNFDLREPCFRSFISW